MKTRGRKKKETRDESPVNNTEKGLSEGEAKFEFGLAKREKFEKKMKLFTLKRSEKLSIISGLSGEANKIIEVSGSRTHLRKLMVTLNTCFGEADEANKLVLALIADHDCKTQAEDYLREVEVMKDLGRIFR